MRALTYCETITPDPKSLRRLSVLIGQSLLVYIPPNRLHNRCYSTKPEGAFSPALTRPAPATRICCLTSEWYFLVAYCRLRNCARWQRQVRDDVQVQNVVAIHEHDLARLVASSLLPS